MIVAFCGQTQITCELDVVEKIFEILKEEVKDGFVEFYLGNYGWFDNVALLSCKKYKRLVNRYAKICFVAPYTQDSTKNITDEAFDEIIYPEIERTPKSGVRQARNRWMVDKADLIISYVSKSGSAQKSLEYAYEANKKFINLGSYTFDKNFE